MTKQHSSARAGTCQKELSVLAFRPLLPSSDGLRACVSVVLGKPQAPAFGGMRPGVVVRRNIDGWRS